MGGVLNPKTDEDRRRRDILRSRHGTGLTFKPWASSQVGQGTWSAVSRVRERVKEIGKSYPATVLRRRDGGTVDVRFNDCGYVAKGVAASDVRRGHRDHERSVPDVGETGWACYRGTKLDLDHVGLGWCWDRDPKTDELRWYRILGIRDLLDYDINQNLSGYEWAKNLDLFDHFKNYYDNALCEAGDPGSGTNKHFWRFKWTPAKGWASGSRY